MVAREVEQHISVHIDQLGALAAVDDRRVRPVEERGPAVAAGQVACGLEEELARRRREPQVLLFLGGSWLSNTGPRHFLRVRLAVALEASLPLVAFAGV